MDIGNPISLSVEVKDHGNFRFKVINYPNKDSIILRPLFEFDYSIEITNEVANDPVIAKKVILKELKILVNKLNKEMNNG